MAGEEEEHAQYAELAAELAEPDKDLPPIEGNDTAFPEYGGRQSEPQPEPRQRAEPQPQQRQQQQPQQRQQGYAELPNVDDDPIEHFDARMRTHEEYLQREHANRQNQDFWNTLEKSENAARAELEEDEYDQATELLKSSRMAELEHVYPDTHEVAVEAYRHGYQSPAHLRQAILQRDAAMVAQQAIANGMEPAWAFYNLALQRGHKPKTVATKSFMKNALRNIDKATPEQFDEFWDHYRKANMQIEGVKDR